ncbi:MAG TPA: hypothetical protein P5121_10535 [Caldilineaceae bacterium]|nr:hypothetical protein [Caldilineaceae bacterium]HRW05524.1 hypothetical protein [Caldilineaceae bacterium]
MFTFVAHKLSLKIVTFAAMVSLVLPLAMTADVAYAKDASRVRFYGIIQKKPANLRGTWVIGGRTVRAVRSTEFDQVDGPLVIGGCAKVDIRNGRVHEIDSEPMRNCR